MSGEKMIHVVFGDRGSYSDRTVWPVRAFDSEAEALKFSAECQQIFDEASERLAWHEEESAEAFNARCHWQHPLDPASSYIGGDGITYYATEIPAGWPLLASTPKEPA